MSPVWRGRGPCRIEAPAALGETTLFFCPAFRCLSTPFISVSDKKVTVCSVDATYSTIGICIPCLPPNVVDPNKTSCYQCRVKRLAMRQLHGNVVYCRLIAGCGSFRPDMPPTVTTQAVLCVTETNSPSTGRAARFVTRGPTRST